MLVTRPEPGASATASRLRALGMDPVSVPLLRLRRCAVALPAAPVQAVVAASANAVALPARFHATPLLAVGDATARAARRVGFSTVHSAGGTATDLAAACASRLDPAAGPLLLAAGKGQGTALRRMLRARGFSVRRRAVYHAAPVRRCPPAMRDAVGAGLRAALFFSAATAATFVRVLPRRLHPRLADTDALAIGPDAALVLARLPWRTVRVAVRPTQDGILALL